MLVLREWGRRWGPETVFGEGRYRLKRSASVDEKGNFRGGEGSSGGGERGQTKSGRWAEVRMEGAT